MEYLKFKKIEDNIIKKKYGLTKNSYILYLSRLVPEKRADLLIDAYQNIKTEKKLVIAGGNSDTNEYVNYLKEKGKNDIDIIFTGFVEGEILKELYSNAYIYVLPSDLEGMPLSLLEAMSYGNCCLVSSIQECIEVIEDKAVIFNKGDVNDLIQKIEYLLSNENIVNKYKMEASGYIYNKYNWDKTTNQIIEIYKEVLNGK